MEAETLAKIVFVGSILVVLLMILCGARFGADDD